MPLPPSAVINAAIRALVMRRAGRQWWAEDLRELARLQTLYLEAKRQEYGTAA